MAACTLACGVAWLSGPSFAVAADDPETRGAAALERVVEGGFEPAVEQGDILVAPATARRGLGYERDRLWPHGIVPVVLDPALSDDTERAIDRAIDIWNAAAGIDIRRMEPTEASGLDHVRFQPGEGCASWVGRRGGAQELWVAPDCATGSIVHELGHALGLEHEHVRPDRDQWIEVLWENVIEAKRHNFDVARPGLVPLGEYDYESIMHYGPDFFSVDGSPTLRPLVGSPRIGQRVRPSVGDIDAIARLYGTDLSLAGSLAPGVSGEIELVLDITNEGARGAHALALSLPSGLAVTAATSSDAWNCETPLADDVARAEPGIRTAEQARCTLARLDAGARSTLALSAMSPDGAAASTGALELVLSSGSDDTDPNDDRLVLGSAERFEDGSTPGADVRLDAGVPLDAAASPFDTVQALAEGTSGRGSVAVADLDPGAVPDSEKPRAGLVTIVAAPDPDAVAGAGASADGNRFERLFGGAGVGLLPLVGLALAARRRRKGAAPTA